MSNLPIQNARLRELAETRGTVQTPVARPNGAPAGAPSFADVLGDALKVSGHAQTRLQSRGIDLDSTQWDRVKDGVDRAAAKGARESLVLVDDAALVVSVKNRTVITAVDRANLKDSVFTNIDSAVIV